MPGSRSPFFLLACLIAGSGSVLGVLESTHGTVEVLSIDHAAKPSVD